MKLHILACGIDQVCWHFYSKHIGWELLNLRLLPSNKYFSSWFGVNNCILHFFRLEWCKRTSQNLEFCQLRKLMSIWLPSVSVIELRRIWLLRLCDVELNHVYLLSWFTKYTSLWYLSITDVEDCICFCYKLGPANQSCLHLLSLKRCTTHVFDWRS